MLIVLLVVIGMILQPSNSTPISLFRDRRAFSYIANETACIVDSIIYHDGDPIPTDDPCESCKCRPPGFSCVLRECKVKPGCKAIRREGECCPEYQCGCEHNGKFFNDGDHIPNAESPCYSCYCQGSSITCALADCKFRFDCEPEYVPNECCPRYDHCQPETPFWTTTSKRPSITRITTMSTTSASPTTSPPITPITTTSTASTPPPSSTQPPPPPTTTKLITTMTTTTTTITPTSMVTSMKEETSVSPDNSPASSSSTSSSPSPSTTIIYSTLAKDEPVKISTSEVDKPSTSSINLEASSPSTVTTTPMIKDAVTTIKVLNEASTLPINPIIPDMKEIDVTSSPITLSSVTESKADDNSEASVTPILLTTEKSIDQSGSSESTFQILPSSTSSSVEATTLSNNEPSSIAPIKPADEPIVSSELPLGDTSSETPISSSENPNIEETASMVNDNPLESSSPSEPDQDSPKSPETENEVTTIVVKPETVSEDKSTNNEEKEINVSMDPKAPNVPDSPIDSTESKSEESINSANTNSEQPEPVTTIVPNGESPAETTTIELEDNYLTTRFPIPDSELRAEHKNGDSDIIVDSDSLDSPTITVSTVTEEISGGDNPNKLTSEVINNMDSASSLSSPSTTSSSSSSPSSETNQPDNNNNEFNTPSPDVNTS